MKQTPTVTDVIWAIMAVASIVVVPLLIIAGPPGWFLLAIWFSILGVCVPDRLSFWLGDQAKKRRGGRPSSQQIWEAKQRKEMRHWRGYRR